MPAPQLLFHCISSTVERRRATGGASDAILESKSAGDYTSPGPYQERIVRARPAQGLDPAADLYGLRGGHGRDGRAGSVFQERLVWGLHLFADDAFLEGPASRTTPARMRARASGAANCNREPRPRSTRV